MNTTKTRIEQFKSKATDPWYGALVKRLTKAELKFCLDFLEANEALGFIEFEFAVNRIYVNSPRTKNWAVVTEVLTVSNVVSDR